MPGDIPGESGPYKKALEVLPNSIAVTFKRTREKLRLSKSLISGS